MGMKSAGNCGVIERRFCARVCLHVANPAGQTATVSGAIVAQRPVATAARLGAVGAERLEAASWRHIIIITLV